MSVRILTGDCLDVMATLDADSIDCVVTSPPYWGLRDYGVEGQMGLEPTMGEHLAVMVEVFRAVRRVLKPSGTVWLNYGDCYATAPNGRSAADTKAAGGDDRTFRDKPFSTVGPVYDVNGGARGGGHRGANKGQCNGVASGRVVAGGFLKPKDLCMIPNRLAIALQDDGWWVRSEIIWGKPNPMPESIKDRPATAHEKIFLLTKSARYFFDAGAVRQGRTDDENANGFRGGSYVGGQPGTDKQSGHGRRHAGFNDRWDAKQRGRTTYGRHTLSDAVPEGERRGLTPRHDGHVNHTALDQTPRGVGRNLRNYERAPLDVWEMATRPFSEAHFATFPPELAERCITAGCPAGGLVLDPFGGAGTTGLVADRLQRDAILIELNPEYAAIAERRIVAESGLFGGVSIEQIERVKAAAE